MKIKVTQVGFDQLQDELTRLRQDRPDAVMHLKKSREMGDLSENGYYKSSRLKLNGIDRRIGELERVFKTIEVETNFPTDRIGFGSTVTIDSNSGEATYQLVSKFETNPQEGRISVESPIGRELIGKTVGQEFHFNEVSYKVIKIS